MPTVAYSLKQIFRFQDDLIVFEDDDVFTTVSGNIYPAEIVLKNTNVSPNEVNYLSLKYHNLCYQYVYVYKSYVKRGDFNFKIMNYPNLSGNVPKKPCYGVCISQLVRYDNINLHIDSFKLDVMVMVDKLITGRSWVKYIFTLGKMYSHLCVKCGHDILSRNFIKHIYGLNVGTIYLVETLLNTFMG